MSPEQKLAVAIAAATLLLVGLTLAIDPDERRQLAAWLAWRARRPDPSRYHDWNDFRRDLALWREQRP